MAALAPGLWMVSRLASGLQEDTGVWIQLLHVPRALLAIGFSLQEMTQFEIPPLPDTAWVPPAVPSVAPG